MYIIPYYAVITAGWLAGLVYVIYKKKEKKKMGSFFMTFVSIFNLAAIKEGLDERNQAKEVKKEETSTEG